MSKDQSSVSELLPRLETSDLQELEHVKSSINEQLNTDRGGVLLSSLVDYYLDSSSPQAVALLSSIREPHDKPLLDKLNECLSKPGSRLHTLVLLGHVVCKQPPWLHKISRSPLLSSLLKCLKADTDVVVLITGALVLITLLPIIPQAGKQHIYDFFDVFGRLASWGLRNPGHVHGVYLVHLHASVYSLFHRLYGMYPCNFISYLRLHYSMKENLATFEEVVKPMLEHVRVHPELVTGTQDYELDPSRWKCCEIHDIVIECSKMSLDPKECSSEEGYSSLPDPLYSHMNLSSAGSPGCTPVSAEQPPVSLSLYLSGSNSYIQNCEGDAVTWSPSSVCGLATPPASPASVLEPSTCFTQPPIIRTTSMSGVKRPSSATTPVTPCPATPLAEELSQPSDNNNQPKQQPMEVPASQQIKEEREGGRSLSLTEVSDFIRERDLDHTTGLKEREDDAITAELLNLTVHASTPSRGEASLGGTAHQPMPWSFRPCFTPIQALATGQPGGTDGGNHHSPYRLEEGGPALFWTPSPHQGPMPPYEPLFQLALPRAASLFVDRKTQEVIQRAGKGGGDGERGGEKDVKEEGEKESSLSPLDVLDHLITHGNDTHQRLSRKLSVDWSQIGGKQQSMRVKGSAQGEELQTLRSQLLLVHSQLQYERYKRQQHAMRNRRLLRRVINATALQEHNDSMKGQLKLQEMEIESLRASLCEEQKRYLQLKHDTHTHTAQLHTQIQQLQQQQQEYYNKTQHLQSELEECQSRLGDLEAELQRANNEAYNAEHQLTQLSFKVSSSEQLEQQMFLLNKQLLLLGETNKLLQNTHTGNTEHNQEVSMVQSSVSKETLRLRDSAAQQTQRLEAANHRITELEAQLARKEQLILEQKKLLEDNKAHSSGQLSACESRYVALKRVTQVLQTEMLQLYSQIDLDAHTYARSHTHTQPQEPASPPEGFITSRPNGSDIVIPTSHSSRSIGNKPSASFSILNGGVEAILSSPLHALSTSPLHPFSASPLPLNLLSTSPIDAPLAAGSYPMEGSFLDQRARELFRPPPHGQEEEKEAQRERREEQGARGQEEVHPPPGSPLPQDTLPRDALPTDTPPRQTLSRDTLPRESLPGDALPRDALLRDTLPRDALPRDAMPPPASVPVVQRAPSLTEAVRQRRYELSIMDYNETLPE